MTNLTNKVAIITGAANGLGKALATELYQQGCHLALLDIDQAGLAKLQSELPTGKQVISLHTTDISQEEQVITARAAILQQHATIDILINNAAVSISQYFQALDLVDYKKLFDTNFWGTVYCCKHFLPDLTQQTDSRLVNIISDFALMGFPGKTTYASSKSAIMGFTNSLMTELKGSHVKVSLVIPPPLDTNIVKAGQHMDEIKRAEEIVFLKKHGMPVIKAARKIIAKVKTGKFRIIIGPMMFWTDLASRLFPTLVHRFIRRNKKRFKFI